MDEVEFQRDARRLIELFELGALVPLDVARRARGNESYSGIYAAMARGELEARKLGGKTTVTAESLVRSILMAPRAVLVTGLAGRTEGLTPEQRAKLAAPSSHGAEMQARRRGRPIGSKSRTLAEAQKITGNRPST
jgi:hypothetical protein